MGFRFQWRPTFGPFRLNFSKRGLRSISIGRRGAHFTIAPSGERTTVGVPGSGLFWSNYKPWRRRTAQPVNVAPRDIENPLQPDMAAPPDVTGASDRIVDVHEGHIALALLILILLGLIVLVGVLR